MSKIGGWRLQNMAAMKTQLDELVKFFGEDPKKMKPKDVLTIVKDFAEDYVKAGNELKAEKAKGEQLPPPTTRTCRV